MPEQLWTERKFPQDLPASEVPAIFQRLAQIVPRIHALTEGVSPEKLTKPLGDIWSVNRQVGHLIDLEPLWSTRVTALGKGAPELGAADMSNTKTHEADHDDHPLEELLARLESDRREWLEKVRQQPGYVYSYRAIHPRLKTPMGLADLLFFVAEHDAHHLERIEEILAAD